MEATIEQEVVDAIATQPERGYCDGKECGATAYYYAKINGTWLSYCGHHANRFETKLMPLASKITDLRYQIEP